MAFKIIISGDDLLRKKFRTKFLKIESKRKITERIWSTNGVIDDLDSNDDEFGSRDLFNLKSNDKIRF